MSSKFKTFFLCFISITLVTIIVVSYTTHKAYTVSQEASYFKPTIIIDPGHGGEDGGAIAGEIVEKDINLRISKKLCDLLIVNGFNVTMTRCTDTAIYSDDATNKKRSDLNNRVKMFNNSSDNIVISIHQNKFVDSKYFGTQIFYSKNNPKSENLALCIKNSVASLIQPDNTRECKKANSEIFVLNNAQVPSVMVECGFLSNNTEAKKLNDEQYQNELAYCIYLGFLEYYYTNY